FELSLISQIAAKNPQRAYDLAENSLKKGYPVTLVQTLEQLRKANPDLANKLSKSIATRLQSESFIENPQAMEMLMTILRNAQVSAGAPGAGGAIHPGQIISPEET